MDDDRARRQQRRIGRALSEVARSFARGRSIEADVVALGLDARETHDAERRRDARDVEGRRRDPSRDTSRVDADPSDPPSNPVDLVDRAGVERTSVPRALASPGDGQETEHVAAQHLASSIPEPPPGGNVVADQSDDDVTADGPSDGVASGAGPDEPSPIVEASSDASVGIRTRASVEDAPAFMDDGPPPPAAPANDGGSVPSAEPETRPSIAPSGHLRLADPSIDRSWIAPNTRPDAAALRVILEEHPDWVGVIGYDEFRRATYKRRPAPWDARSGEWSSCDVDEMRCWLSTALRAPHVSAETIATAVRVVANHARYDSLSEHVRSVKWDGVERLWSWSVRYLRAVDTAYHRDVAARWLLSAVARALSPGCKADHVLVLEAPRGGERKSSTVRTIAGESDSGESYFRDSPINLTSDFAANQIVGAWVYEVPEMTLFNHADSDRAKAFISQEQDDYSRKHANEITRQPRRCVFAATTQRKNYLVDPSGNRRWWPVPVGRIDLDSLRRDRDQIVAEASETLVPYLSTHPTSGRLVFDEDRLLVDDRQWWLGSAAEAVAREEQDVRYQADVWEEQVSTWMHRSRELLITRGYTYVGEILSQALKIKPGLWSRSNEMRVASILVDRFGWRRGARRTGPAGTGRVYPYYLPADDSGGPQTPSGDAPKGLVDRVDRADDGPDDVVDSADESMSRAT